MHLPFGSTDKRVSVFDDLAASQRPRRAIALYGFASFLLIGFLSLGWLWLSQYLSTAYGLELRNTLSGNSQGKVTLPNFPGVIAGILWLAIWLVGMKQIRKLALRIGQNSGPTI
jgi:hypothetical protein